mgnify:CR=1 FL=1
MNVCLSKVAQINPRTNASLDPQTVVSFVPMASLSAETAGVTSTEDRLYREVSKGFTPFQTGDILFAKITPCFENGKIAQALIPHINGFGSTEFHVVRPKPELLDGRYLHHFLRQGHIRVQGERRMTGSGGQRRVPTNFLSDLEIPLPPLPEQRRIAAILDQADALRAKRREALAQLDRLTQAIFVEMFGDPVSNLMRWPVAQLSELVVQGDNINYGVIQPGDTLDVGVPLVRVGDLTDGQVSHDALKRIDPSIEGAYRRSRLCGDEILVSCVGTIGLVAMVMPAEAGFNIARAVARIRLSPTVDREFIAEQLRTPSIQRYFTQELRTVSQPTLNIKQLAETQVLLPPPEMQATFKERMSAFKQVKSAHRKAFSEMDALFTSLQHRAFRGEL